MGKVLLRLSPAESAFVLHSLLKHHPDLVAEAEEVATALVTHVDADAVAENVEKAVLDLNILDLDGRAGRQSWGYVEPSEAAWETLAEAIDPFVDGMRRHIELGFHAPATAICAGVVCGLYRCRGRGSAGFSAGPRNSLRRPPHGPWRPWRKRAPRSTGAFGGSPPRSSAAFRSGRR